MILLAGILIYFVSEKIKAEEVVLLVERAGIWGPLVYILFLGSTFVFAPLSGTPFFLAGYLLFGKNVQLLSYVAAVLAGAVNFLIAKRWGRGIVIKMVGEKNMNKVDEFTQDYGVKTLIFLRVLQGQFHDFISYAFGLTEMKFLPFFLVTLLAPIPWTAFWYFFLFNYIDSFAQFAVISSASLIPFYFVSIFLYARWRRKKLRA